jgi:hypothetical protein
MTAEELMKVVQTYRYSDSLYVIVDSLPMPFHESFVAFLRGLAVPVGDGLNRYAFISDFERWLDTCPSVQRARP